MAFDSTVAIDPQNLRVSYGGTVIAGLTDISNVGTGGTNPDVDVTTLSSKAREFKLGLGDGGSANATAIIDPHSAVYRELLDANNNRTSDELRIVFGYAAEGLAQTDGKGWVTRVDVPCTAALEQSKVVFTVTKANAGRVPGTGKGHYVRYGNAPTNTPIESVTRVTSGSDEGNIKIGTALTTLPTPAVTKLTFVTPAFEFRRECRIMEFQHSVAIDTPLGMTITFRYTGPGTFTAGTPDITI